MLIVKLWNCFKGYVTIKIEGFALEKFLNLLVREEIFVWDIIRQSNTCIYLKVNKKDFPKLKSILKKVSCRIEIVDKKGLPFILNKIKKRKFLVLGGLLAIICVFFFTSFIWTINIIGNKRISDDILLKQLQQLGVKKGEWKYKFNEEKLENELIFANPDLNYVKINFIGTKVQVEIVEREVLPPEQNMDIPTNVIAERDGIIHNIFSYGGEPVVKEGDLVKKGDLLISGEILNKEFTKENEETEEIKSEETTRKVHAWGDVYAKTWYELEVIVPTKIKQEKQEKNEKNKVEQRSIILGKIEFTPRKKDIPYKKYDKIEKSTPIIDWKGFEIPIYIKNTVYYPTIEKKELTQKEIKKEALKIARKNIEKKRNQKIDIINNRMEIINKDENYAKIQMFVEAIEQIGKIQEIK
ncbi:sporulation protein YqfD [Garciella nitratireducens]|uniref:sporulation protein YqfD n=1 Tax=Garciella nitratireducens TaxID=218205 RepID=UPI000DE8E8F5|nr:sporulation protein YqfD [Garciella nitratireducens]RBP45499.1 hypothetical protein DFR81_10231 [Garciella nitratireducens]